MMRSLSWTFVTIAFNDSMGLMMQCSQHDARPHTVFLVSLSSLQPLAFINELHAFFFELELLNFSACGFGVVFDPEDILGYWRPFVSFMPVFPTISNISDMN